MMIFRSNEAAAAYGLWGEKKRKTLISSSGEYQVSARAEASIFWNKEIYLFMQFHY